MLKNNFDQSDGYCGMQEPFEKDKVINLLQLKKQECANRWR